VLDAVYAPLDGFGAQRLSVTAKIRELLRAGATSITALNEALDLKPDNLFSDLLLRYEYRGKRAAVHLEPRQQISVSMLADIADQGIWPDAYFEGAPIWPDRDPPLEPGVRGPGTAPAPQKELAIMALVRTLANLEPLAANNDKTAVDTIPIVRQALADAQRDIQYPFPPRFAGPAEPGPDDSVLGRLRNAARNLTLAKELLNDLPRNLAAIDQALTILVERTGPLPGGAGFDMRSIR
jgi:hypothetical protein